ncbi:excitatory amino acid transporter 1-like isoform X1 [Styela clava]
MPARIKKPTCEGVKKWMRANLLLIATIIGSFLGIALGLILRPFKLPKRTLEIVALPGDLFMRALYLMVGPLLLSSIISGLTGVESENVGAAGALVTVYYLATTVFASGLGVTLGLIGLGNDGDNNSSRSSMSDTRKVSTTMGDVVVDIFRNLVPDNIVRAFMQTENTKYRVPNSDNIQVNTNQTDIAEFERYIAYSDSVNFIGIISFSVLFGVALGTIGKQGEILKRSINGLNHVVMKMITYIMYTSPIGVLFLIAGNIAMAEKLEESIKKLALLSVLALTGVFIHTIFVSLLYFAILRRNPLRLIAKTKEALVMAWATASSYAALPVTIHCLEENVKISKEITRLVLPIGATVNMDAGAIHMSLFIIYVSRLYNVTLGFGQVMKIVLYSAFASIGSAAIPQSFLTAALIVLKSLELPTRELGLLFTIEWFIDRFKTALNVYGDCVGTCMVNHWRNKKYTNDGDKTHKRSSNNTVQVEEGDTKVQEETV